MGNNPHRNKGSDTAGSLDFCFVIRYEMREHGEPSHQQDPKDLTFIDS